MSRVDDGGEARVARKGGHGLLFDRPDPDPAKASAQLLTPGALKVAREAAAASMVLLENRNETLPLKPGLKRIAVIGSMAKTPSDHMGPWGAKLRA